MPLFSRNVILVYIKYTALCTDLILPRAVHFVQLSTSGTKGGKVLKLYQIWPTVAKFGTLELDVRYSISFQAINTPMQLLS